ncbi:MAG: hypothetical protein OER96_03680 [Gammaproteobacteria bacterium]|nr:hypothetical protein [Gammaproteobacteria bacterium]
MEYTKGELAKFGAEDFDPGKNWWEAIRGFTFWSIPALLFVLSVNYFESLRSVSYYEDAISQGIAPKSWNVAFLPGLMLFLLSLIFIRVHWISIVVHKILINVFAIGALMFGLLLGQIICQIPEAYEFYGSWRFYLTGLGLAIGLLIFAMMNVFIWYLSYLNSWDDQFRTKISMVSAVFRIVVSGTFGFLLLWYFWMEK